MRYIAFWSTSEVDKYIRIASKCNIQIKKQNLLTSPFPRVGVVEKCEGNVNLHSTVSLSIWSITLLSKYSRTLLTTFLRFSRFRIFGDTAFWNKAPQMYISERLIINAYLKMSTFFSNFIKCVRILLVLIISIRSSVSKATSLRFSNFLTDEQKYSETFEIHQRQYWSMYETCVTFFTRHEPHFV